MNLTTYEGIAAFSRQAVEELKRPNCDGTYDDDPREIIKDSIIRHELIAEACEKQIQKKPRYGSRGIVAGIDGGNCVECGRLIFVPHTYCNNCGHKIEWRKYDETSNT